MVPLRGNQPHYPQPKPTVPGWYWAKTPRAPQPGVCYFDGQGYWLAGNAGRVPPGALDDWTFWGGPLQPPPMPPPSIPTNVA